MASGKDKPVLKLVIAPVPAARPYYLATVYEEGRVIARLKRISSPEHITRWLIYNQSLVRHGYVRLEKSGKGVVRVSFNRLVDRHFKLFLFHAYSVSNIKSLAKADCLAKCWSSIDSVSPLIDVLWELSRITDQKRFTRMLRGYCSC
ncbi:MAG: hypothetical protein QXH45_06435 [Thermosphaera sp.]